MSLKAFHIVFMTASALCMGLSAYWGGRLAEGALRLPFLLASTLGMLSCLAYLRWFLRSYRTLK